LSAPVEFIYTNEPLNCMFIIFYPHLRGRSIWVQVGVINSSDNFLVLTASCRTLFIMFRYIILELREGQPLI